MVAVLEWCLGHSNIHYYYYSYYSYYRMAVSDYWHTYYLHLLEKIGGKLGETQEHNIAKKVPKVHEMAVYMVNIASKIK